MDSIRRAAEAYWRTPMVDGVTSNEEKVAPVYKLDEVCDLLRASHAGIVKEVSDYVLMRLDHKSPIVKQKVRMKACCVLESILRENDDEHFFYYSILLLENSDSVVKSSELPQVSPREKANKVLNFLGGDQISGVGKSEEPSDAKPLPVPAVQIPDLIDTGKPDEFGTEASIKKQVDQSIWEVPSSESLVDVDDLFGSGPILDLSTNGNRGEDDPFADVSFHVSEDEKHDDIFSRFTVDGLKDPIMSQKQLIVMSREFLIFSVPTLRIFYSKKEQIRTM